MRPPSPIKSIADQNTRPVRQMPDEFASHVDMGDALNDTA
jgi:hypothetical protein